MSGLKDLTGQVLDDKYRIEKQLGEGGMGAVFLATHLGTDRPVALKLIAPQFMGREEFVERFRREARAAGRLQHPNVVDVTDFGFALLDNESVAYLVMEHLDGCLLSEILAEESRLAIDWVVDILEQACSAVAEAHRQGIIHRDLKPDNIWLEPNRRGGYTVKVLDFGLAKLGEPNAQADEGGLTAAIPPRSEQQSHAPADPETSLNAAQPAKIEVGRASEDATLVVAPLEEEKTRVMARGEVTSPGSTRTAAGATPVSADEATTRILGNSTDGHTAMGTARVSGRTVDVHKAVETSSNDGLTRVGSILGTPLYMSPEQCRGEPLDARSDIYSLGVIAYQMLAGQTPFVGDAQWVIRQHSETAPPPLKERRHEVPKRMADLVMTCLAKDPAQRPVSAAAFASALRGTSEGSGALLRRAFAFYSEHFPPFLRVAFLMYLPLIAFNAILMVTSLLSTKMIISKGAGTVIETIISLLLFFVSFVTNSVIAGVTIRLVTQLYLAPQRPLQLSIAYAALKRRFRALVTTTILSGLISMLGLVLFVIPGVIFFINYSLSAPVVMMEGLSGRAALRRSKALVKRARRTVILILFVQWSIPAFVSGFIGALLSVSLKLARFESAPILASRLTTIFVTILNVLIVPLIATLTALLYLKTRQIGGETLRESLSQFEEEDARRTKWQMRMRERISTTSQSPRTTVNRT